MASQFHYKQKSNKQKYIIILRIPKIVIILKIITYKKLFHIKKIFFPSDLIIMVRPTEYKQRETVKNNGTKDYKNMSKKKGY